MNLVSKVILSAFLCLPALAQSYRVPVSAITAMQSGIVAPTPTKWYVRKDGGTRYSVNVPTGQCDGKADVSYASTGGTGVNQHCAYNEWRFMWDDKSGKVGAGAWVIAGGDWVIIRDCKAGPGQINPSGPNCRAGWDAPTGTGDNIWCYGVGSYTCYNPPIPVGTAAMHTRILGQCAVTGTCNPTGDRNPKTYASNLTQIFGGFSLKYALNLSGAQYVDVQGLEITSHNGQCTKGGAPAYPRGCSSDQPLDDYDDEGIRTDQTTSNLLLQDVYVHGFNDAGIFGPIGGPVTMDHVFIGFNGKVGWQFDDGNNTPDAPGSKILAQHVTMIGNGCYEEYPVTHAFPASACYDDVSNGFGDAWSGQDTDLDTFICLDCMMAYNTKDAFIGPHTNVKTLTITNSQSYGNMGAQWKWNNTPGANTTFENNLTVGNCARFSAPIPGAAHSFALSSGLGGAYLSDYCRAGGNTVAINSQQNSHVLFANNTFVDYFDTVFLLSCGPANQNHNKMCGTTPFVFTNNIFLGYHLFNADPNNALPPGLFYLDDTSITVTQNNNIAYANRAGTGEVCGVNGNLCVDPLLVNEPAQQAWTDQTFLDNFNFNLTSSSPAIGAGAIYPGMLSTDASGAAMPAKPQIGALAPAAPAPTPTPTPTPTPVPTPTPTPVPVQVWTKVANEADVVNVPAGTTVRYGFGTKWMAAKVFATATTFTASNTFFGGDPFPNQAKEVDALGTGAGITTGTPTPPPPAPVVLPPFTVKPAAITIQPPSITVTPPPITCTPTLSADGKSITVVCK